VVVKSQLDAVGIPAHFEFNATDKTVWNNGKGNIIGNTSFGELNLKSITSGDSNSAFGYYSLLNLTIGADNSAFGRSALGNTVNGYSNTAIGSFSLASNTSGFYNTAIGATSLQALTNGSGNVAIGYQCAVSDSGVGYVTSNTSSVYIGKRIRPLAGTNNNEIIIGADVIGNLGSNTVTLGNGNIVKTLLGGVIQKRALDTAPASATDAGTTGEIRVTATHIYVCTATNTWVRSALTTW
jgi:hypothetical protein